VVPVQRPGRDRHLHEPHEGASAGSPIPPPRIDRQTEAFLAYWSREPSRPHGGDGPGYRGTASRIPRRAAGSPRAPRRAGTLANRIGQCPCGAFRRWGRSAFSRVYLRWLRMTHPSRRQSQAGADLPLRQRLGRASHGWTCSLLGEIPDGPNRIRDGPQPRACVRGCTGPDQPEAGRPGPEHQVPCLLRRQA
jgi:hypothetical protein